nr:hypothetical protein [DPANN group archaeon]
KYKSNLSLEKRAKAVVKFLKNARIDSLQMLNAVPLPGSELRAKLDAEGRLLPLETVGWDKYDGQFLCYDPTSEGLNPYELQNLPRALMKKRYQGSFISRKINYGNWMNWTYNATIGFPIQFGIFYMKRFVHNLIEKRREQSITKRRRFLPTRNIFHESLVNAWSDIRRKWRNLAMKTYGANIVRRWMKAYKESDYSKRLKQLYVKKRIS